MKQKYLYVIDKDCCPEHDNTIIMQDLCKGCDYYAGFELYQDQRCIHCTFCAQEESENPV